MKNALPPTPAMAILLITLLLTGCGTPNQSPDPAPEPFRGYYAGELVEREISRLENEPQSVLDSRLDSLRHLYGFSRVETDSLLREVRATRPRWEAFLNDVLERIERREDTLNGNGNNPARKDTNGIR
jgi:hypothetical protein